MNANDPLLNLLNSYSGRDGIIRTLGYASLFMGGVTTGKTSKCLKTISSEFSHCRVILRLFDDWPMLRYTLSYGLGEEEKDIILRAIGVVKNIADQVFYPVEHIAWLADKGVINVQSGRWWIAGTVLWAFSLYCGIARSLRILTVLQKKKDQIIGGYSESNKEDLDMIFRQQRKHFLAILQYSADLINAISWFPNGILWAGKLKAWQNGLLGMVSSVLAFVVRYSMD